MCLILFSYAPDSNYRLVLAANRDEFRDRPTAPLANWDDASQIIGGRDLKSGGTWLGITYYGKWAAVTNFRDPGAVMPEAPSRGHLLSDFLFGKKTPGEYLKYITKTAHRYNGFNLIIGDTHEVMYFSNKGEGIEKIQPGLYGLSNHLLDTPWPKIQTGKNRFSRLLKHSEKIDIEEIFELLRNTDRPPDHQLPQTGVGLEWERFLSPIFISGELYGTRSSSILIVKNSGAVTFVERSYPSCMKRDAGHDTRQIRFNISK